eukprot:CAMPEP_0196591410 /NCGR_PEP_ID=MMETSP1081-20130531/69530_1 /TAXON_ID=36882 /ORGANISM="Pyramimonas amylifera, Strain CCMP720" /LENGTH=414 /DNA_ID=CAMNT_0041914765 /DNA_START=201 /DNA_END=1445 /DNA_ORIENTATION=+
MVKALDSYSSSATTPPTKFVTPDKFRPPPYDATTPAVNIRISQHGDAYNKEFFEGLDLESKQMLHKFMNSDLPAAPVVYICHSEPGAWSPPLYSTPACPPPSPPLPPPHYLIGRTTFETDRITPTHVGRCNRMDEVWVPSEFNRQTFIRSGVEPAKIFTVPEPVDVDFFDPSTVEPLPLPIGRPVFPAPNSSSSAAEFSFLSIFKWEDRKGWDVLLRAFLSEFQAGDDVALYMLTSAYHSKKAFLKQIRKVAEERGSASGQAQVFLIGEHIPTTELPRLFKSVDAFVLPSRGEGWGRPHVEAMAMSLPIIATNWSGPTEYMTEENSYPLQYEGLVEVKEGAFKGHLWAEPSEDHLRTLMRHLTEHPAEAKQRGNRARQDMIRRFSPSRVSKILVEQFERIAKLKSQLSDHHEEL